MVGAREKGERRMGVTLHAKTRTETMVVDGEAAASAGCNGRLEVERSCVKAGRGGGGGAQERHSASLLSCNGAEMKRHGGCETETRACGGPVLGEDDSHGGGWKMMVVCDGEGDDCAMAE
ncbi:phytoene desaturase [Sesbania bispinosa]|nr:phytoene desaturase [Sesbania bispinosa]